MFDFSKHYYKCFSFYSLSCMVLHLQARMRNETKKHTNKNYAFFVLPEKKEPKNRSILMIFDLDVQTYATHSRIKSKNKIKIFFSLLPIGKKFLHISSTT